MNGADCQCHFLGFGLERAIFLGTGFFERIFRKTDSDSGDFVFERGNFFFEGGPLGRESFFGLIDENWGQRGAH